MTNEVTQTALRMLAWYSTPEKASEIAWYHSLDYEIYDPVREYWRMVSFRIAELSRVLEG